MHVSVVQHTMQHCWLRQRREAERRSVRERAALNVDVPPYWLEQRPRPDYVVRMRDLRRTSVAIAFDRTYRSQRNSAAGSRARAHVGGVQVVQPVGLGQPVLGIHPPNAGQLCLRQALRC